jgi:hypothetical protein
MHVFIAQSEIALLQNEPIARVQLIRSSTCIALATAGGQYIPAGNTFKWGDFAWACFSKGRTSASQQDQCRAIR